MAGAFNDAWMLLKQRGFEVMPRQRAGPSLAPTPRQLLEALESGDFSQVEEAERLEERRNKTEEREMDPMTRHLLNQQAEDIEAEGIELPDVPSSGPPIGTDYGRAGSTSSEPIRPIFNPFDPNEVALRRQTMANEQTPLGQALAAARAKKPQPLDFTPRDDQGQELQYFPEGQEPMTHTEMVRAYGPDFQERFGDRVNPFQVSVEELKRRQQQGEQQ